MEESGDALRGGILSVWREWTEGLKLVFRERRVTALFIILATAMLADSILSALIAPFVGGAGTLVFAGVPLAPVSMACAVAIGIPAVGWIASQQTLLQKSVADAYLGRVFGAFSATTALTLMYCAAGLLALILLPRHQAGG